VDHIVAWDLWKSKLETYRREESGDEGDTIDVIIEFNSRVNELGNCMLLSLFQNSWGSRVFEGVSGLGVGQAGAGSYLNSLIS